MNGFSNQFSVYVPDIQKIDQTRTQNSLAQLALKQGQRDIDMAPTLEARAKDRHNAHMAAEKRAQDQYDIARVDRGRKLLAKAMASVTDQAGYGRLKSAACLEVRSVLINR